MEASKLKSKNVPLLHVIPNESFPSQEEVDLLAQQAERGRREVSEAEHVLRMLSTALFQAEASFSEAVHQRSAGLKALELEEAFRKHPEAITEFAALSHLTAVQTKEFIACWTGSQEGVYEDKVFVQPSNDYKMVVTLRHDDQCRNGHNTFSLTCMIYRKRTGTIRWMEEGGGADHEAIASHFPQLAPFVKWHLCSTDGPMHYIENTLYWVGNPDDDMKKALENARSCAIWPDATDEDLQPEGLVDRLVGRLPKLMSDFRNAVTSLGLTY